MYSVALTDEAVRTFKSVDRPLAKKISKCFVHLQHDPRRHNNIKRLTGRLNGLYRYRVGDYRVIYAINDVSRTVRIMAIAHRREAYE